MNSMWRDQAACIGAGDLMFPEPGDRRGITEARRVCASCPVMTVCLADAMKDEDGRSKANRFGIRGGRDTGQRYAMYRRLVPAPRTVRPNNSGKPLAPCGTQAAYERHLRRKEPVDEACRKAHNDRRRADRAQARTKTTA